MLPLYDYRDTRLCLGHQLEQVFISVTMRVWDEDGWYRESDVISTNVQWNDSMRAHRALRSKESLRAYQMEHGIPLELDPILVVMRMIRPAVESMIRQQGVRFGRFK